MREAQDVDEVGSYDDLSVGTSSTGRVLLSCPSCGDLPIPGRETTLSDLTNAAVEHLLEVHPDTFAVTLGLPAARRRGRPANPEVYRFDDFWSWIALLGPQGAGGDIEALVRSLGASTADSILTFHQQLMATVDALDTPGHASQVVVDVDDALAGLSSAEADVFLHARVAVVAAGPQVYALVLADPAKLAGRWPLRAAESVLNAAPTAFGRVTGRSWASHPARELPGRAAAAALVQRENTSHPGTVRA